MAKPQQHKSTKRNPKKDSLKPQKTITKTKTKRKPESAPLQIEDDVPDFPRGGGSTLSRKEEDEVRAEVDAEFQREQSGSTKKGSSNKNKKRNSAAEDDDFGSLFGEGITGKLPKYANRITLKNVAPGMKMWGVISEVNEKDLVVNLPGGLRGLVRANEASDLLADNEIKDSEHNFLSSNFHVGQLVSCIVVQVDDDKSDGKGKRKIWLSLRLALLHKSLTFDAVQQGLALIAYVKSIEDHGYILHFGPASFSGFLPRNNEDGCEMKLNAGQLLQGVVRSIDRARQVIHMSSDPDIISKCVTKDIKGISIDLLVPGMMVNARVQSTLENGILLSFLTYFTGTVDVFHLQNIFPSTTWKEDYSQHKKVNARILFIDPSTRAVGLTMNPHLVHNKGPPSHVKAGDIFERSRIVRVDKGVGLLLEIPSTPMPTPAYVSIFDISDEETPKWEKKFEEGNNVRVRILGFRHLEGLALGTLKASAFEGSLFTHSDVKPGMVVKGKVVSVETFGAIVQFFSGVKALCPLPHMSEFDIVKPRKKFKVGADLFFRVLGCKAKRITVTHKKSLLKSKLPILSSYADATDGLVTHGWITKIEKHGCFVRFYNGVQGFAPRSELGLEPGVEPGAMHHVGQVVKCRVVNAVPSSRRINLSFIISKTRGPKDDIVKLGAVVSGVVERVTPKAVIVHVNASGHLKGSILSEHLADHQGQATSMKSILKPGYEFDQLLVLDFDGNNLVLSAKYSLVSLAMKLPADVAQIHPDELIHGYICNIIESGCFVRFLGRVTAFSPKHKALDDQRTDFSEAFYVGQSVRSRVLNVDSETNRITLSLKQSSCFSTDVSFMQAYFLMEEKIANLQTPDPEESKWVENFCIGSIVEGKIHEAKEGGVILRFKQHKDVFGFVSHQHLDGSNAVTGSVVQAMVLDISKTEHLVDLSLKPELVCRSKEEKVNRQTSKKKRKRDLSVNLEVHQTVNAVIQCKKDNYLVLSLPEFNHAIGYASSADYNTQKLRRKNFEVGQSVVATVGALPGPSTAGRLLLLLNSVSEVKETSSSKRAKKSSAYDVGSLVEAEVTDIKPLEMQLKFGSGFRGRLHITEANDDNIAEPFKRFRIGQMLTARIVEKFDHSRQNSKNYLWELSVKSAVLSGSGEMEDGLTMGNIKFSGRDMVSGYVVAVDRDWVWLTISRHVKAQLFLLDSSCEPSELEEFQKRYTVGKLVTGHIIGFNKEKRIIRLLSRPISVLSKGDGSLTTDDSGQEPSSGNVSEHHILEGDVIGGRVTKILPGAGGLVVQIGPHLNGKVHFTELTDKWVANPLSEYVEGQFVKCKVLEVSRSVQGYVHIDLSLRYSTEDTQIPKSSGIHNDLEFSSTRFEKIEEFQLNMVVQGYVKNVTSKGCFIMLSRKVDAKILLSNLSSCFIENPEKEFPVGKLVQGKVLSVEPMSKRVEVTLKTEDNGNASKFEKRDFSTLHVGEVISGRIKRIEAFGLFITIEHTNMVGLCHVSELSDNHIENIESTYRVGERVAAKILKVDEERHRISLGMKESYMTNDSNGSVPVNQNTDDSTDVDSVVDDHDITMTQTTNMPTIVYAENTNANGETPVLKYAESRASVPPLEVTLDDMNDSDLDNVGGEKLEPVNGTNTTTEKKRAGKKKAKEERELEIRAAEQRLLEKDVPSSADEFEKMVRSSPNSSFVWIKYMAYMLSLADIEKARSIAERALMTINIREEAEKLNVWVAYFNLENEYGSPKEEAVAKTFQKALQYCDPKKVHLALLGMYERTEQYKLAEELLEKMTKKFKHSCKVWLRRVQNILKQDKDGIQSIVNRALQCLPQNKHIKFISQTGILEFKSGVPDRGRSMFEKMLREYPKRTDLWSVYLDQEIRLGDVDKIRGLFERAISLSLPPKKMKFLFKKYLEYEKAHGDEERVEYVKRRAIEYVEEGASAA